MVLLGVAAGTPLYVLGGQKTELKNQVTELTAANAELAATDAALIAANAELQTTVIAQDSTISGLETSNEALQLKEDVQDSLILEYQQAIAGQGDYIAELVASVELRQQIITQLEEMGNGLLGNISSLEAQLLAQYDINSILQGQKTQLEGMIGGLGTVIGELESALQQLIAQTIELSVVQAMMIAVMASNDTNSVQALPKGNRTNNLSTKPLASDGGVLTFDFSDFLSSTDTDYWYYWDGNGVVSQSATAP